MNLSETRKGAFNLFGTASSISPLPSPISKISKDVPPRPNLFSQVLGYDIFRLEWNLKFGPNHSEIKNFEIFACIQQLKSVKISPWKKVGDVKPPSPYATSQVISKKMTGFTHGYRYQLAVRGVDTWDREGTFSRPVTVILPKQRSYTLD